MLNKASVACIIFGSAFGLSGCVAVSPETAGKKSVQELCLGAMQGVMGNGQSSATRVAALEELKSRRVFSDKEMVQIEASRPVPGMSEEAGLCAWGYSPAGTNTTATANGASTQYVFGGGQYSKPWFLYAEKGVITAVQK
jgi:hypothetical protein